MKTSKKKPLKAVGGLLVLLLAGIIFFFTYYQVDEVQVMGSSHYSEKQIFFLFHSDFPLSGKTYIYVIYCFNHILEEIPYKNTSTYDSILVNMIVYIFSSPIPGLIIRKQK